MPTDYETCEKQFAGLASGERDRLALSANFVALLYAAMDDVNWLGIYVARGDELVLGPFQGLPACVHIPVGQGVCGTAAARKETTLVDDVHAFDGHIVCDPLSKSELVVPMLDDDRLLGVLDIDSPTVARFSESDQIGVERLVHCLIGTLRSAGPVPLPFI